MSSPAPEVASAAPTSSSSSSPIIVHHLQDSRSQRVLWLLEELSLPYKVVRYERTEGLAPPELLAVHPLGKSPVISDGSRVLAESGAIVDYLLHKYSPPDAGYFPKDEDERLDVNYWNHAAEGSVMPLLVMKKVFTRIVDQSPWVMKPVASGISSGVNKGFIDPNLKRQFEFIESALVKNKEKTGGEFMVGRHLTAADFQLVFPIEAAASRAAEFVGPRTLEYLARIHARPEYKRALEQGGPYAYASCQ